MFGFRNRTVSPPVNRRLRAVAAAASVLILASTFSAAQENIGGIFKDRVLAIAIALTFDKRLADITVAEFRLKLKQLRLNNPSITNLAGLEYAESLESLIVTDVNLYTNEPVTHMPNLRILILDRCGLYVLRLDDMPDLQTLHVRDGFIEDLRDLRNTPNLANLAVDGNPIQNREVIAIGGLTEIYHLSLASTPISDIDALHQLAKTRFLYLQNTYIEDVASLGKMPKLEVVDIGNTRVTNLKPLVDNAGVGAGDVIYAKGLDLDRETLCNHIPDLIARGAAVYYDGTCPPNQRAEVPKVTITEPLHIAQTD